MHSFSTGSLAVLSGGLRLVEKHRFRRLCAIARVRQVDSLEKGKHLSWTALLA
ncbi:hypothetical protein SynROS8604_03058 [Synechococcus sp. ROS8604]|nr:hypothetical protein SynROS8604_03058 [Synechococcus sp. ROS8604]